MSVLTFSRLSAFVRVAPEPVLSLICQVKNSSSARPVKLLSIPLTGPMLREARQ